MLTKTEISAAPSTLDDIDIEMWLALIRQLPDYQRNKEYFPNLETKLGDASGTTKGSMLNAILDRIESIGVGVVQLRGGDEGLIYSQEAERSALIKYGLGVLYDVGYYMPAFVVLTEGQTISGFAAGQRGLSHSCPYCTPQNISCGCGYIQHPGGRATMI